MSPLRLSWLSLGLCLAVVGVAPAQTYTWTATTGNWSTPSNWSNNFNPSGTGSTDHLVFGGATGYVATNDVANRPGFYLNRLTLNSSGGTPTLSAVGTYPNQANLRFLGSNPTVDQIGGGGFVLSLPMYAAEGQNVTMTVGATAGPLTIGNLTSNTTWAFGTGTFTVQNNNTTTPVELGVLESFYGTFAVRGPGTVRSAVNVGFGLFSGYGVLDVGPGATFDFASNPEVMGGLIGSGTVTGNADMQFVRPINMEWSGNITGTPNVIKDGLTGNTTLTYRGLNTYGGATVLFGGTMRLVDDGAMPLSSGILIGSGSNLILDNTGTANNNNRVADTGLTLGVILSGDLRYLGRNGTASTENAGPLYIGGLSVPAVGLFPASGAATIEVVAGSGGTAELTFDSILPFGRGAYVTFAGNGTTRFVNTPTLTNGIFGYANVGSEWATVNAANQVVPLTTYQTAANPAAWAATDNVKVNAALAGPTGTRTINSLNIASAQTIDLGGGTLTLAAGGVLANATSSITNGTIVGGQPFNPELIAYVSSGRTLTIGATIDNSGSGGQSLVKVGPGTLVLTGNNLHTQGTRVFGGTLEVGGDANLGAATGQLLLTEATLRITAPGFTTNREVLLGGLDNVIDLGANNATFGNFIRGGTLPSAFGGIAQGMGFTKTGSGTMILSGTDARITSSGGITIAQGGLRLAANDALSDLSVVTIAAGAFVDNSFGTPESFGAPAGAGDLIGRTGTSFSFASPADTVFAGRITAGTDGVVTPGSALTINKNGPGSLTLGGASDFDGAVNVNLGTLRVAATVTPGQDGPLGRGAAPVNLGATVGGEPARFLINTAGVAVNRGLNVVGGGTGVITFGSEHSGGSSTYGGPITLNRAAELTVAAGATTNLTGGISGGGSLVKIGGGTANITGAVNLTGNANLAVTQGELRLNGPVSLGASGVVFSNGTGTLSGTGTITAANTVVAAGGTIAPGNSVGALSINGQLVLAGSSLSGVTGRYLFEIDRPTGTPGTDWDLINATNILIAAATPSAPFEVAIDSPVPVITASNNLTPFTWTIAQATSPIAGYADGHVVVQPTANFNALNDLGGGTLSVLLVNGGNALAVQFTPIPEPGMILTLCGAAAAVGGWLRRRKSAAVTG